MSFWLTPSGKIAANASGIPFYTTWRALRACCCGCSYCEDCGGTDDVYPPILYAPTSELARLFACDLTWPTDTLFFTLSSGTYSAALVIPIDPECEEGDYGFASESLYIQISFSDGCWRFQFEYMKTTECYDEYYNPYNMVYNTRSWQGCKDENTPVGYYILLCDSSICVTDAGSTNLHAPPSFRIKEGSYKYQQCWWDDLCGGSGTAPTLLVEYLDDNRGLFVQDGEVYAPVEYSEELPTLTLRDADFEVFSNAFYCWNHAGDPAVLTNVEADYETNTNLGIVNEGTGGKSFTPCQMWHGMNTGLQGTYNFTDGTELTIYAPGDGYILFSPLIVDPFRFKMQGSTVGIDGDYELVTTQNPCGPRIYSCGGIFIYQYDGKWIATADAYGTETPTVLADSIDADISAAWTDGYCYVYYYEEYSATYNIRVDFEFNDVACGNPPIAGGFSTSELINNVGHPFKVTTGDKIHARGYGTRAHFYGCLVQWRFIPCQK